MKGELYITLTGESEEVYRVFPSGCIRPLGKGEGGPALCEHPIIAIPSPLWCVSPRAATS